MLRLFLLWAEFLLFALFFFIHSINMRRLEMLRYVAEGHGFESGLGHLASGKLSLCNPSCKWVSFSNHRRIRQLKERDGLCLSHAVPKIQLASNLTLPLQSLGFGKMLPFVRHSHSCRACSLQNWREK